MKLSRENKATLNVLPIAIVALALIAFFGFIGWLILYLLGNVVFYVLGGLIALALIIRGVIAILLRRGWDIEDFQ